jgi:hypothetical protein
MAPMLAEAIESCHALLEISSTQRSRYERAHAVPFVKRIYDMYTCGCKETQAWEWICGCGEILRLRYPIQIGDCVTALDHSHSRVSPPIGRRYRAFWYHDRFISGVCRVSAQALMPTEVDSHGLLTKTGS